MDKNWFDSQYENIEGQGVDGWLIGVRASQRARLNQILEALSKFPQSYESVLDIGCGIGIFGSMFKKKFSVNNYTGSDISEKAIRYAKNVSESTSNFVTCALPELPESHMKHDLILMLEVLYYLEPDQRDIAMKNIINALQLGGYLCITGSTANHMYFSEKFFTDFYTKELKLITKAYHHSRIYYHVENFLMIPVRLHNLLLAPIEAQPRGKNYFVKKIKHIAQKRVVRLCLKPMLKLLSSIALVLLQSDLLFKIVNKPSKVFFPKYSVSGMIMIYQKR